MQRLITPRFILIGAVTALVGTVACAQTPADATPRKAPVEQRSEVITHQDAGSHIEELRVGGETRRIDVETHSRVPGYQVKPVDNGTNDDPKGAAGKTSWKVLKF